MSMNIEIPSNPDHFQEPTRSLLQLKAPLFRAGMGGEIYSDEDEGDKPQTNEPPKGNPRPLGRGEVSSLKIWMVYPKL